MKQSELIKQLSDQALKKSLILTQLFFACLAIIISLFVFNHPSDWFFYFKWNLQEIFYYGVLSGLLIVSIDIILIYSIPKRYYDDGGINERIFKSLSVKEIFVIVLIIAICEELLFRGLLQTAFGYFFASIIFALVHIRYLTKPVLLISVVLVSFLIGYIFELTSNLFVTITCHFVIDFLLGILIRFQK